MSHLSLYNYNILESYYRNGNLDGLDLEVKKNSKKIYLLSKSLSFDNLIDKIVQLIDRILSYFSDNYQWDWPKRYLELKTKEALSSFSKRKIIHLNKKVPAEYSGILSPYTDSNKLTILPYTVFHSTYCKSLSILSPELIDVTKKYIIPYLKDSDIHNLFEAFLPHQPIWNKKAGSVYFDLIKERKFHPKLSVLLEALKICGKEIQSLDLNNTHLTDDDFELICALCPNLSILNLKSNYELSIQSMQHLSKLEKLTSLNLSNCTKIIDDVKDLPKHLEQLNQLTSLEISDVWFTDEHLQHLSKLNRLSSLDLSSSYSITDKALIHLLQFPQLTSLNLSRCNKITDAGLQHLSQLSKITSINVSWCTQITDQGLQNLSTLNKLSYLNVMWCFQITDLGLKYISKLNELSSFIVEGCYLITDEGIQHLSQLTKLSLLNISFCKQITDASMQYLACLSKLTNLDIKCCTQITDHGLQYLSKNLHLVP